MDPRASSLWAVSCPFHNQPEKKNHKNPNPAGRGVVGNLVTHDFFPNTLPTSTHGKRGGATHVESIDPENHPGIPPAPPATTTKPQGSPCGSPPSLKRKEKKRDRDDFSLMVLFPVRLSHNKKKTSEQSPLHIPPSGGKFFEKKKGYKTIRSKNQGGTAPLRTPKDHQDWDPNRP